MYPNFINQSPHGFFRKENSARIFALFSFLISLTTIPVTLFLVQQQQDIRQYAAEKESSVTSVPSVTIISPSLDFPLSRQKAVTLAAIKQSASEVSRIEFYINGIYICAVHDSPYTCTWTPTTSGKVTITARMYDTKGNETEDSITTRVAQ